MFIKNYLYELPDDIQSTIYKMVFARCLTDIERDKSIKYLNRLYKANTHPSNTCVYSVKPKGMFGDSDDSDECVKCDSGYKYRCVAALETASKPALETAGTCKRHIKPLIFLDRTHLIEDIRHLNSDIVSLYMYPLFSASRNLKKYLTTRLNLVKFYNTKMIREITVIDDRINILFTKHFACNADIYYNIMVAYNVLYNSLSNVIYSEANVAMFNKFVELFRWLEMNNVLEGYNMCYNKVIPMFNTR
jgi:hypothetical protein